MKKILILVLLVGLNAPTFGQYSKSLDSLSRKEIRQLILNQQNEVPKATEMMRKNQNSRMACYTFLAATAVVIGVGIANGRKQETRAGSAVNTGLTISGSLLTLIPAGICGLVGHSRYEKAKKLYLNKPSPQNFN